MDELFNGPNGTIAAFSKSLTLKHDPIRGRFLVANEGRATENKQNVDNRQAGIFVCFALLPRIPLKQHSSRKMNSQFSIFPDIPIGSLIVRERPYSIVAFDDLQDLFCSHCLQPIGNDAHFKCEK